MVQLSEGRNHCGSQKLTMITSHLVLALQLDLIYIPSACGIPVQLGH